MDHLKCNLFCFIRRRNHSIARKIYGALRNAEYAKYRPTLKSYHEPKLQHQRLQYTMKPSQNIGQPKMQCVSIILTL